MSEMQIEGLRGFYRLASTDELVVGFSNVPGAGLNLPASLLPVFNTDPYLKRFLPYAGDLEAIQKAADAIDTLEALPEIQDHKVLAP